MENGSGYRNNRSDSVFFRFTPQEINNQIHKISQNL